MKRNIIKAFAAAAIVAFGFTGAQAASSSSNLNVRINITSGCTFGFDHSNNTVDFGSWAQIPSAGLDATRQVTVTCAGGNAATATTYSLALSGGSSGDAANRHMEDAAGNTVNYKVTKTATCGGQIWGDTAGSDQLFEGTINSGIVENVHDFTVCIDKASNPTVAEGDYADTLRATLTY